MRTKFWLNWLGALLVVAIAAIGSQRQAQAESAGGVVIGDLEYGPCKNATYSVGAPQACDADCVVYCTDYCSAYVWKAATCRNVEGPCVRKAKNKAKEYCRDCFCTWPFGGCVERDPYDSGSVSVIECE